MAFPQVVLSVLLVGQLGIEGLGAISRSPLTHGIAGVIRVVVDDGPKYEYNKCEYRNINMTYKTDGTI